MRGRLAARLRPTSNPASSRTMSLSLDLSTHTCFSNSMISSSWACLSPAMCMQSIINQPAYMPTPNTLVHGSRTISQSAAVIHTPMLIEKHIVVFQSRLRAIPIIRVSPVTIPILIPARRSLAPLEFELLPGPRLRIKPSHLQYQAYTTPTVELQQPVQQQSSQSSRLQEIVSRLGEICLSPEVAHVMLFGAHACSFASSLTTQQDFPRAYTETCEDPYAVLIAMDMPPNIQNNALAAKKFLAQFQATCLPPPTFTTLRQPVHLCAWRLDAPPRICLYTGEHPSDPTSIDPSMLLPHTLSKVLLEERTKRPNPARIHLTSHDEISPNAARLSLLHYAQTALTTQREKLPSQPNSTVLHHTLEEAIACLIHPPLRNHTTIELNQSPPWDKDHIDSRYFNRVFPTYPCRCPTWHHRGAGPHGGA